MRPIREDKETVSSLKRLAIGLIGNVKRGLNKTKPMTQIHSRNIIKKINFMQDAKRLPLHEYEKSWVTGSAACSVGSLGPFITYFL